MWDFPTEDSLLGPRLVGTAGGTAVTFLMLRRSSIAPRLVGGGVPALAVVFYDRIRRDISLRDAVALSRGNHENIGSALLLTTMVVLRAGPQTGFNIWRKRKRDKPVLAAIGGGREILRSQPLPVRLGTPIRC